MGLVCRGFFRFENFVVVYDGFEMVQAFIRWSMVGSVIFVVVHVVHA
jgi:hypothetical protein